ncbi:MAG TPA: hypothetical protein PLR07_14795 [Promineifilum sp.]|nr:hypothetical protein [Promineifilum sp.]
MPIGPACVSGTSDGDSAAFGQQGDHVVALVGQVGEKALGVGHGGSIAKPDTRYEMRDTNYELRASLVTPTQSAP